MKEINLTKGYVAKVDDEDYDYLMQWKWFPKITKRGKRTYAYAVCNFNDNGKWRAITMHRVILKPKDYEFIDHIDHDGFNNQKHNIRICTRGQNQMNRFACSASGYVGVYKKRNGRYEATISYNQKKLTLGHYLTAEEAAHVRDSAALKYHGQFATLNFPIKQFYERDFVEWLVSNSSYAMTTAELFEYWKTNIEKK